VAARSSAPPVDAPLTRRRRGAAATPCRRSEWKLSAPRPRHGSSASRNTQPSQSTSIDAAPSEADPGPWWRCGRAGAGAPARPARGPWRGGATRTAASAVTASARWTCGLRERWDSAGRRRADRGRVVGPGRGAGGQGSCRCGVERRAQPVAGTFERHHGAHDREPGEERHPPQRRDWSLPLRMMLSSPSAPRLDARKRAPPRADHVADDQRVATSTGRERVGQDVAGGMRGGRGRAPGGHDVLASRTARTSPGARGAHAEPR
jgi:hypothetical protein